MLWLLPCQMTLDRIVGLENFHAVSGTYKVVQLMVDDVPVCVFGTGNHRRILAMYLQERGLHAPQIPVPQAEKLTMPALEGPGYRVVGMGHVIVHAQQRIIERKESASADYGIGLDPQLSDALPSSLPDWHFR